MTYKDESGIETKISKRVGLLIEMYDRVRADSQYKLSPGRSMEFVRQLAKIDHRDKEDYVVWDNFFSYVLHTVMDEAE